MLAYLDGACADGDAGEIADALGAVAGARGPEDTTLRLKQLAPSRGISLNKLMEELGTAALAVHDTETRFRLLAPAGDRKAALIFWRGWT